MLSLLRQLCLETESDGIGQRLVLFFSLVELLLGKALELGDGGMVVVLLLNISAPSQSHRLGSLSKVDSHTTNHGGGSPACDSSLLSSMPNLTTLYKLKERLRLIYNTTCTRT